MIARMQVLPEYLDLMQLAARERGQVALDVFYRERADALLERLRIAMPPDLELLNVLPHVLRRDLDEAVLEYSLSRAVSCRRHTDTWGTY